MPVAPENGKPRVGKARRLRGGFLVWDGIVFVYTVPYLVDWSFRILSSAYRPAASATVVATDHPDIRCFLQLLECRTGGLRFEWLRFSPL